ncbi:MAG: TonB-dependent receptor [Bacteroidetes bacterium]|nr:TonB-dependent receptor [Bacteroidota bacterium]
MKFSVLQYTFAFLCIFLITNLNAETPGKATLSGKITDNADSSALIGAVIYFPDLKNGTQTDINGNYKIENLPVGSFTIEVSCTGYATITEKILLSENTVINFKMESTPTEMPGVVITGQSSSADPKKIPTPISVVTTLQLQQNISTNIIDAIAKQPGISQVGTGPGISKPVIRGLGYNRVVVVNDGIRQEGQQWGDEHGIEIDEYGANRVEILKGPASLAYGSDAMAGVVNIISAPTLSQGTVTGNIISNYQTNNGLVAGSANIAGNLNGLTWDARYTHKQAHDYVNKYDGGVFDSRFTENDFSGTIGLNRSWGYSNFILSSYHLSPGIVEGRRDSATGKFIKEVRVNSTTIADSLANTDDLHSYQMATPHQEIHHYKAIWNSSFIVGDGQIKTTFGFQQNQRQEFADVLHPENYGLYFLMNTINYDVRYIFPEKNNLQITSGVNGMQQDSKNKGVEFLVPEYSLFDIGTFVTARKSFEKLDISGGLRYDLREEHTANLYLDSNGIKTSSSDPDAIHKFSSSRNSFSGISGSAGISYELSKIFYTKFNISRGYRAPGINEVGANGVHEGSLRYERGNPELKAENSLQFDLAFGVDSKHVSGEIDLFDNNIQNFIYARKLSSVNGGDSITQGYSTFKFVSGNAQLMGGEATIDIHPHPFDWLHFENSFGFVIAQQKNATDSTKYLPFTPAPVYRMELRANIPKPGRSFQNVYVKFEVENYFAQNNIYSAYHTETATKGCTLLNAGCGGDIIRNGETVCSVFFSVNNITDVAYQNHLSRLKYSDMNYVTGRTGVYNMGRNFSLKLNIPLYFKKAKTN